MPALGLSMNCLVSRHYTGGSDLGLLIEFAASAAKARWPRSTYKKVGDVVWMMRAPGFDPFADLQLWFDGSELVAYGWFDPPLNFDFDIKPGLAAYDSLGDEILQWAEARRRTLARAGEQSIPKAFSMLGYDAVAMTEVLRSDEQRKSLVERRGYTQTEGFGVVYSRSLEDLIAAPKLDSSLLRLRHATDADLEERVDLHRDAWSAWGSSTWTSTERLKALEGYRWLRNAPVYDQELDIVLEDPSGRFLAYCIGWFDAVNGFGHFEPVGCRPTCTRRRYARAVMVEAMRRMRARGTHTALVATAGVNAPARALYPSCGFVEVERAHHYTKDISA